MMSYGSGMALYSSSEYASMCRHTLGTRKEGKLGNPPMMRPTEVSYDIISVSVTVTNAKNANSISPYGRIAVSTIPVINHI